MTGGWDAMLADEHARGLHSDGCACSSAQPRLLDLYCCQGGAAMGYHLAGFQVVGVDIDPQPRYPFEFHQADAVEFVRERGHEFDAVHASPPCQKHTRAQKIMKRDHPDLIEPTRAALIATGLPYVIENVPGAPLIDPVELCGSMFGLATYRHRGFEVGGFTLTAPEHPEHTARTTKMGRPPREDEYMHIVGNFSGVERARGVMAMPWANRDGLREAIPPAFTEHIGRAMLAAMLVHKSQRTGAGTMSYEPRVGVDYAYETDCPAWKCPHISVHDWREGRRCVEHPCTCPEPKEQEQ